MLYFSIYSKFLTNNKITYLNLKVYEEKQEYWLIKDGLLNNYIIHKNQENQNWKIYQNIAGQFEIEKFSKLSKYDILVKAVNFEEKQNYDLRFYFFKYLTNLDFVYKEYVLPVLFGHYLNLKNNLIQNINELNSIHLLIISGLHYNIIYILLVKITKKFDKKLVLSCFIICLFFDFHVIQLVLFAALFLFYFLGT
ncbi:ComEC/Rec2 family competence protein [Mycoplasma buteonis]|uniref:ComEC/Rec2 family competence protein n=1 Tax=Mycoplasma buteonis TaxID=171280 RepID=UPI00146FA599|nr:hypothetical protein [Mycoplasma buteonis]